MACFPSSGARALSHPPQLKAAPACWAAKSFSFARAFRGHLMSSFFGAIPSSRAEVGNRLLPASLTWTLLFLLVIEVTYLDVSNDRFQVPLVVLPVISADRYEGCLGVESLGIQPKRN